MTSDDLHLLTGVYAAGALLEAERQAFERHLRACRACAVEARELQATAARLGEAVSEAPPPELWDRIQASIRTVRQLPPEREAQPPAEAQAGRPRRGGRPAGGLAWLRMRPVMAAAALLVVAIVLGGVSLDLGHRLQRSRTDSARVAAVLAAPDAETHAARAAGGGEGRVVLSARRGEAVFVAAGLPPAPATRTYQLWLVGPSGARSAGLLATGSGGGGTRLLRGVDGAERVALTVEPGGGSAQPTSAPVLVVDL